MVKIVGNLKELIDKGAVQYISLNEEKFRSTTPGPMGADGPRGPQGVGVHHMKCTSTTDPEGDFSTAGELDTYTFYADANEEFPLAWFTVKNGEDPWRRAVDRGYRGTEEEFYKDLTDAIKYSESDKVLTDVNKVNLSTDTNLVASVGQITWNPNERTADIGLDNNVVLQVGQETVALVRNGTASSIPDGTVVMLTGSIGNSGRLVVAPYDGVADASLILGIATETIAAGADGFVTSYGKIRGIDTSMWSDGDVLYTSGSGLATTPTSTLSMKIAVVVHSHTNGTLMVRVNGYSQVKEW